MSRLQRRSFRFAVTPLAAAAAVFVGLGLPLQVAAQALSAHRIVIDKDSGRPRMPEHDELAAAAATASAARSSARSPGGSTHPAQEALQSHPMAPLMQPRPLQAALGAKGHRTGTNRLAFTVVQRQQDGSFASQCVTGESALAKALAGQTTGGRHDH